MIYYKQGRLFDQQSKNKHSTHCLNADMTKCPMIRGLLTGSTDIDKLYFSKGL